METNHAFPLDAYFDEAHVQAATVEHYGGGHINETYLVTMPDGKFILQKLNTYVFKHPEDVMDNLMEISHFLRERVAARGGDVHRELINVVCTKDGRHSVVTEDGSFWRVTEFIDHTKTYDVIETPKMFEECAVAFGTFQNELALFPATTLKETIPDFHNTPDRYRQFEEAIAENKAGRLSNVADEIAFVKAHRPVCNKLMDLLHEGKLPLRVTHNDTKLSNILYDVDSNEPICVIDLDTTMPGLVAYDFGDAIRGGAGTAAEDEKDLSKVGVNLDLFDAFTKGFLSTVGKSLTELEIDTLPDGAILMTLECGIRFLTDYLNGDVYFHTAYPEHNLVRAHNMFKMVTEMEANRDKLDAIIRKYKA